MQTRQIQVKQHQTIKVKYQKNISAIYRQRRRILHQLNQKHKQKKNFTVQTQKSLIYNKNQQQVHDNLRKIAKLESDQQPKKSKQQINKLEKQAKYDKNQQTKGMQNPSKVPQGIADRNRRVFGGLTSYLKKAGQQLRSKESRQKQETARQILNKLIQKERVEREQVQIQQRKSIDEQIKRLEEQRKSNQEKLNRIQNQMLGQIVRSHFNEIGKFHMTRTDPKIFWRPIKTLENSDKIEKIHQYQEKYLKRQRDEFQEKINSYNQVLDYGKYVTQNQKQFYSNFLSKMYNNHKNFILTKAEPLLFWKPRNLAENMNVFLSQSQLTLDEKLQGLKSQNIQYYNSIQSQTGQLNKQELDQENSQHQGSQ